MLFGERQRYILPTCVVVVIAMAGAEAAHKQGGQIWTFTASTDGANSGTTPSLADKQNFDVERACSVKRPRKRTRPFILDSYFDFFLARGGEEWQSMACHV